MKPERLDMAELIRSIDKGYRTFCRNRGLNENSFDWRVEGLATQRVRDEAMRERTKEVLKLEKTLARQLLVPVEPEPPEPLTII